MTRPVVVLDNYDSFTYNLMQYLAIGGAHPVVLRNSVELAEVVRHQPSHLVISAGPGTVEDPGSYGVCLDALRHFAGRIPVLGVCLGHQLIGHCYGAKSGQLETVRHGHVSQVRLIAASRLFAGLDGTFRAMRYHSLVVDDATVPDVLRVTGVAEDDGSVMALEHVDLPVFGVQFHPESIGTPCGRRIIENFLSQTGPRSDHG